MPYPVFALVLMLSRRCNLRCDYCYAGPDDCEPLPAAWARRAIERAVASTRAGGRLELGFFGGEPLLHAREILALADVARDACARAGLRLHLHLTTNGTLASAEAWEVLAAEEIDLAVSFDALPEVHDRHRRTREGRPSSPLVLATLGRLLQTGRDFCVVPVVRPDSVVSLPAGLRYILDLGVRSIQPTLDLWARWSEADLQALEAALAECAEIWRGVAGRAAIGWLDRMAALAAGLPSPDCARCLFGAGQVAVSPRGTLYPCERLIGADATDQRYRLSGHVADGEDFLDYRPQPPRDAPACRECTIAHLCDTACRCSNLVRSGEMTRPDALLCRLNRAVHGGLTRVLQPLERNQP